MKERRRKDEREERRAEGRKEMQLANVCIIVGLYSNPVLSLLLSL